NPKKRRISNTEDTKTRVAQCFQGHHLSGACVIDEPALLIELHSKMQSHRREDLFDLVEGFPPEVFGLEHIGLRLLDKLADSSNIGVLKTVVGANRQFQLVNRPIEVFVEGYSSRFFAVSFCQLRLFFEAD